MSITIPNNKSNNATTSYFHNNNYNQLENYFQGQSNPSIPLQISNHVEHKLDLQIAFAETPMWKWIWFYGEVVSFSYFGLDFLCKGTSLEGFGCRALQYRTSMKLLLIAYNITQSKSQKNSRIKWNQSNVRSTNFMLTTKGEIGKIPPLFLKFLAKKHCFGNKWQSTTFLELEFQKLEFLISFATVALLRWKLEII